MASRLSDVLPQDPRNRKLLLLLLLALCAVFGTIVAYATYTSWYVIDTRTVDVRFTVTEGAAIGFDLNTTDLTFGKVPKGGGGDRTITLAAETPAVAHLAVSPPLDAWVVPSAREVRLEPGVPVELSVGLSVPKDVPMGPVNGTLSIVYVRDLKGVLVGIFK